MALGDAVLDEDTGAGPGGLAPDLAEVVLHLVVGMGSPGRNFPRLVMKTSWAMRRP
ncbi:hypothetical protein OWM54_33590 [Myxococcus sp. MISCRS1]|uniref:hypothetical protein n=1 Tax=Myxococcus sp. MISCRS1 TaxID=2996786 RepID=UPI00226EFC45|nr:hypothetical protein [Myxococcus sp. MISCRS1]MCY1002097.1 hypothetical protein [Myxococcus sp. MISCRS1]